MRKKNRTLNEWAKPNLTLLLGVLTGMLFTKTYWWILPLMLIAFNIGWWSKEQKTKSKEEDLFE